ncbi:MAG: M48 family metalloprotease, partial [Hyphomicrobiaceae bacterium]
AISQTREFTADAGAIELTKNPAALVSALRKVALDDDLPISGYASRAMMFSSTPEPFLGVLIGSHPPIQARIDAVMLHGGVTSRELMLGEPSRVAEREQPPASFGRRRIVHGLPGFGSRTPQAFPVNSSMRGPQAASRLGRRAPFATNIDPGQRPIAEPALLQTAASSTTADGGTGDWIVGRKADRVAGRAASLIERVFLAAAYLSIGMVILTFGLIILVRKPLMLLALVGLAIWLLTGRARRDVDRLSAKFGSGSRR